MALADSWHLRSCSPTCSTSGREFEAEEVFYTAIFPDPESEAFERRDFSEGAWNKRTEEDDQPFSFWRSVFKPRPVEEKVQMVEKDDPETLLKRLVEEDEEHTENVRYILAVMLERQKLLVETDSQQTPTGLLRIYEHRREGDVYIIKDPQIPLSEVDNVQEEIRALLDPEEDVEEEIESPEEEGQEASEAKSTDDSDVADEDEDEDEDEDKDKD